MTAEQAPNNRSEGPRFRLRFRGRSAHLRLQSPVSFRLGALEALEVELDALSGRLDLRAGAAALRHRRGTVVHCVIRLDLDALAALGAPGGSDWRAISGSEFELHLPYRTIAFRWGAFWLGADLMLTLMDVRSALDGPESAYAELIRALRGAGLEFDFEWGAFRVEKAFESLLAEVMVPLGWKVPSAHGASRASVRSEPSGVVVELGRSSRLEPDAEADGESRRARRIAVAAAPLLALAIADSRDELRAALNELREDGGELAGLADELGLDREASESRSPTFRFRSALRGGDLELALSAVRVILDEESSPALALEATRDAMTVAGEAGNYPAVLELAGRALQRFPEVVELATLSLEWASKGLRDAPEYDWDALLEPALSDWGASIRPDPGFAWTITAAQLANQMGRPDYALDSWRRVASKMPNDPLVMRGLAVSYAALGNTDAALEAWDSIADSTGGLERCHACVEAANLAAAQGSSRGALSRLTRAHDALPKGAPLEFRVDILVRLAGLQRALGGIESAFDTETELLALVPRAGHLPRLRDGLSAMARENAQDRRVLRARAALRALRQAGERVEALEAELAELLGPPGA